jgi:hypothetical protein
LHLSDLGRGVAVRIDDKRNELCLGDQLAQQLKALWAQLTGKDGDACGIAARPVEARDELLLDWVAAAAEHDWNCRGRGLSGECCSGGSGDDNGRPTTNPIGREPLAVALVRWPSQVAAASLTRVNSRPCVGQSLTRHSRSSSRSAVLGQVVGNSSYQEHFADKRGVIPRYLLVASRRDYLGAHVTHDDADIDARSGEMFQQCCCERTVAAVAV